MFLEQPIQICIWRVCDACGHKPKMDGNIIGSSIDPNDDRDQDQDQDQDHVHRSRSCRNPKRHKANARERNRMHGLNRALDDLRRRIPLSSNIITSAGLLRPKCCEIEHYRNRQYDYLNHQHQQQYLLHQQQQQQQQQQDQWIESSQELQQHQQQQQQLIIEPPIPPRLSKIETLRMARNYLVLLTETLRTGERYNALMIGQILAYGLGQQSLNQLAGSLGLDGSRRAIGQPSGAVRQIFERYSCVTAAAAASSASSSISVDNRLNQIETPSSSSSTNSSNELIFGNDFV